MPLSRRPRTPTTHGRISTCHPSSRYTCSASRSGAYVLEDQSIGLLTSTIAIFRSDWDTSTRSGCKRPIQIMPSWLSEVLARERASSCFHAGGRHAAESQTCAGHGSLFVHFPAVLKALREERRDQLAHLIVGRRAGLSKLLAYTGEMGQGFSRSGTKGAVC